MTARELKALADRVRDLARRAELEDADARLTAMWARWAAWWASFWR